MAYKVQSWDIDQPIKPLFFLINQLGISHAAAARLIDKKRVRLNGELLRVKTPVRGHIEVLLFDPAPSGLKPFFITPDFAVFDKPAGMLVHPNGFDSGGTLLDDARAIFGGEAQICHRIARETSGAVIVARHKRAEAAIKGLFECHLVKKTYLALVRGRLEGRRLIDAPIVQGSRARADRLGIPKVIGEVNYECGKPARTLVTPLRFFGSRNATLVAAEPATGRTHQIRLHLAHIGCPIVGDQLYSNTAECAARFLAHEMSREEQIAAFGADRLMLHAQKLRFFYRSQFAITSKMELGNFNNC